MYEKIKDTIKATGISPVNVYVDNSYLTIEMTNFLLQLKLSRDKPSPDDFKAIPKNGHIGWWDLQELRELDKISGRIKTIWWHEYRFSPEIIEQSQ